MTQKKQKAITTVVESFFKNSKGDPYQLTPGQCSIFESVINPSLKWVWISAPTRYGKSDTLAISLVYLAVFHNLKIPIVAGSEEKARKIMEYVIAHVADHPQLYGGLLNTDLARVERLKVQMSKQGLRWSGGGWIYITSVDSRAISREGEGVVGEGGDVVVLEEAGLIKHKEQFSKVVRMIEGDWGKLIMSGNCIEKSVFEDAYNDSLYYKVRIPLEQAIAEGRIDEDRLEQQKKQTTSKDWKRYYLVEFPKAGEFAYFKPQKYEYLPNKLKKVGAVDLALGETKKGSKTGIVILGKDEKGQIYEVDSFKLLLKPEETARMILNFSHEFERFGVEAVQFQRYFLQTINARSKELGRYIPFKGIEQKRKKEERIESLEPAINTGQILFKGDNDLWKDMQDYPDCEYMDVLDALEMAWRLVQVKKRRVFSQKPQGF